MLITAYAVCVLVLIKIYTINLIHIFEEILEHLNILCHSHTLTLVFNEIYCALACSICDMDDVTHKDIGTKCSMYGISVGQHSQALTCHTPKSL